MINKAILHAKNGNWPMAAIEAMPEDVFAAFYNRRADAQLRRAGQAWKVETGDETWTLPRAKDALRITHIGERPEIRVLMKYQNAPHVIIGEGDVVVDVGAFIGEFSMQAWKTRLPKKITAIEPDIKSYHCLTNNAPHSVDTYERAIHFQDGDHTFHVSGDRSESSLIGVDGGGGTEFEIKTYRLDSFIDEVDFLKIDAEGMEPEVLMSMGQLRPAKIAVDVSDERDGNSTRWECEELLHNRGYAFVYDEDKKVLFGWKR